jgi:hypothetical protein
MYARVALEAAHTSRHSDYAERRRVVAVDRADAFETVLHRFRREEVLVEDGDVVPGRE